MICSLRSRRIIKEDTGKITGGPFGAAFLFCLQNFADGIMLLTVSVDIYDTGVNKLC